MASRRPHAVKLNCNINQFYEAMTYLDDVMKLHANVDWTPDMRAWDQGEFYINFKDPTLAMVFKLSWKP